MLTDIRSSSRKLNAKVTKVDIAKPNVVESIKQKEEASGLLTYTEQGWIHQVFPQTDRVYVKVRTHELTAWGLPVFFNQDPLNPELEVATVLPLVNFDPTTGASLDALVGKRVLVHINGYGIAYKAEIAYATPEDSLYEYGFKLTDFHLIKDHPQGVDTALKNMGIPEEHIEVLHKLEDKPLEPGVFRILGEGYWDQAVEGFSERTIEVINTIEEWKEKNLMPMKTKLCHNPVIAFSAR